MVRSKLAELVHSWNGSLPPWDRGTLQQYLGCHHICAVSGQVCSYQLSASFTANGFETCAERPYPDRWAAKCTRTARVRSSNFDTAFFLSFAQCMAVKKGNILSVTHCVRVPLLNSSLLTLMCPKVIHGVEPDIHVAVPKDGLRAGCIFVCSK